MVNHQVSPFGTTLERHGTNVILGLSGELVLGSIDDFYAALDEVRSEPLELLVIDLRPLDFLDSSGLRALIAAEGHALGEGYALQIVRGTEQVSEVFRFTGLDRNLPMVEAPTVGSRDLGESPESTPANAT
jgi:anti-sigma B factor antagonist